MATINSFLDYLHNNNKCSDKIYDEILSSRNRHKQLLCDKCGGYDVYRIADVEDINLEYKQVWFDDTQGTITDFDVVIEVCLEVEDVSEKHHDHDSYNSTLWVLISYKGDLTKKLKDFIVLRADEFDSGSKPRKPFSTTMEEMDMKK